MVELLAAKGAELEARDTESGATPLYDAASWGRAAVVELLVARGANPNVRGKTGASALASASANGFDEVAKFLRAHGAK